MLQPARRKYRKEQKGRNTGVATRGSSVAFGDFGLKCTDRGRLTARQIESARRAISRHVKRGGRIWIRVFPDKPITKKPLEVRQGKGKGAVEYWVALIQPGLVQGKLSSAGRNVFAGAARALLDECGLDSGSYTLKPAGGVRERASARRNYWNDSVSLMQPTVSPKPSLEACAAAIAVRVAGTSSAGTENDISAFPWTTFWMIVSTLTCASATPSPAARARRSDSMKPPPTMTSAAMTLPLVDDDARNALLEELRMPGPDRLRYVADAFRAGLA